MPTQPPDDDLPSFLTPEFRTYLQSRPQTPPGARDEDGLPLFLSPEFRAHLKSQPDFDPAAYTSSAGPAPDDDLFALLEGRRPAPRGYRGRRIAVVRGIHPRNFLIAIITWITVFGGCFIFSLFYNLLFAR